MSATDRRLKRAIADDDFAECDTCRAKPGTPLLCAGCLHNRELIGRLKERRDQPAAEPAGAEHRSWPAHTHGQRGNCDCYSCTHLEMERAEWLLRQAMIHVFFADPMLYDEINKHLAPQRPAVKMDTPDILDQLKVNHEIG